MKRNFAAFVAGLLFSAGLVLAGMTHPSKILAFLDVSGRWDPSLAVVMIGAVGVSALAFRFAARRSTSALGAPLALPDRARPIDVRLVAGAALFGLGWGLSGLCPGPAVIALAGGETGALVFVAAMLGGMALYRAYERATVALSGHDVRNCE